MSNIQLIPRSHSVIPMSGVPESSGTEDGAWHVRAGSLRRGSGIRTGIPDES